MSETQERQTTFVGLSKDQFLVVSFGVFAMITLTCVVLLAFSVSANSAAINASDRRASAAEALAREGQAIIHEDKVALCGIKQNAQDQVEATANFLAKNTSPNPLGIPRKQFIANLEKERAFRDTLRGLPCG